MNPQFNPNRIHLRSNFLVESLERRMLLAMVDWKLIQTRQRANGHRRYDKVGI